MRIYICYDNTYYTDTCKYVAKVVDSEDKAQDWKDEYNSGILEREGTLEFHWATYEPFSLT